jgi:hypothetical protein
MDRIAMFRAVLALLQSTEVSGIAALQAAIAALVTKFQLLVTLIDLQLSNTKGATAIRQRLYADITELALVVAARVRSFAEAHARPELADKLRFVPSAFRKLRIELRLAYIRQIHEAASSVIAELADYAVTPELLVDFALKLDAATRAASTPRLPIIERKQATRQLTELLSEIDALLKEQIDPLVDSLRQSNPAAYHRYKSARKLMGRRRSRKAEAGDGDGADGNVVPPDAGNTAVTSTSATAA